MDNLTLQKATYQNIKDVLKFPNDEFKVVEILRFLPNKRVVFKAIKNDKEVVIKLFFNKDRKKRNKEYQKEVGTIKILTNLKLATPELLDYKKLYYRDYDYVVTKYIGICNKKLDIQSYYKAIAALHNHGIYQEDIHIDNFITNSDKFYYLDASGMDLKYYHQKILPKIALDNLALFICQFNLNEQEKFIENLEYYFQNITYLSKSEIQKNSQKYKKYIIKKTKKTFAKRLKDYGQKIFRNCSDFVTCKLVDKNKNKISGVFERKTYYKYQSFFEQFINNPNLFKSKIIKYFKKGNTAEVYLLDTGSTKFVIKYYKSKNKIHSFKNYFLKTRAKKSWFFSNICNFLEIKTIKPVGYFELKKFGFFKGAYFITKYDENLNDLNEILEKKSKLKINVIASNIVENIKSLKQHKIYHGDFKILNILANSSNDNNNFFIIDLEQMKQVSNKTYFNYLHNKDYNRLLKSLDKYKDIRNLVIEKMKVK